MRTHIILYVRDQMASTQFYRQVLQQAPTLEVPGMTEFTLSPATVLGLMPEAGIQRLLGDVLPSPILGHGIPRAEIYLVVENPMIYYQRALTVGATNLSPLLPRDWGHEVAYCLDLDSHVLAFAKEL